MLEGRRVHVPQFRRAGAGLQRREDADRLDVPIVQRAVVLEFERADRMRDPFNRVGQGVGKIIGRIDAPGGSRPVMSGVFCQFSEDHSIFVATDAHKLVRYTRHDARAGMSAAFIMPKKPLQLLRGLLTGLDDAVKIDFNKTNALFHFGMVTVVCRLIDGKYPNYEAVIPKQNPNKLTVDRSTFLGALKRVSIFSNKATHQVRVKIAGSQLTISAEDHDYANEAKEQLLCTYTGQDMEIGFNSRFLLEMLNNLESDEIQLEMSAPNRAGIISPAAKINPSEDVLMLVMPVMLNN